MTKTQILARLAELELEAKEIEAELKAIQTTESYIMSDVASRTDEIHHMLNRRRTAVEVRIAKWNRECDELNDHAAKLAA